MKLIIQEQQKKAKKLSVGRLYGSGDYIHARYDNFETAVKSKNKNILKKKQNLKNCRGKFSLEK